MLVPKSNGARVRIPTARLTLECNDDHLSTGGDILIKFHDGAVYDGPYVLEACLNFKGSVPPGEQTREIALQDTTSTLIYFETKLRL